LWNSWWWLLWYIVAWPCRFTQLVLFKVALLVSLKQVAVVKHEVLLEVKEFYIFALFSTEGASFSSASIFDVVVLLRQYNTTKVQRMMVRQVHWT